jgi:hypothetical protein
MLSSAAPKSDEKSRKINGIADDLCSKHSSGEMDNYLYKSSP